VQGVHPPIKGLTRSMEVMAGLWAPQAHLATKAWLI
jgi:hypothetical protein